MGNAILREKNNGQGMLEGAIGTILMILFLGGIVNIWFWANSEIVRRQQAYNATRVVAGTGYDVSVTEYNNNQPYWPLTEACANSGKCSYAPGELTENKVLLSAPQIGGGP
jgi:hypothetical protein